MAILYINCHLECNTELVDHVVIFEFSAEAQDLVRITDWLPIVKD